MIRAILISAALLGFLLFISNPYAMHIRVWKKIGILFLLLFAIFTVLVPEATNVIANRLGVGRGTDLLVYASIVGFIFVTAGLYLYEKQNKHLLIKVMRKLAIAEANADEHNLKVKR